MIFEILIKNEDSFVYKVVNKLEAIDKFGNIVYDINKRGHLRIKLDNLLSSV